MAYACSVKIGIQITIYGKQLKQNKMTHYRVYDGQRGIYFATGYNAISMDELIEDFKSYISMANECDDLDQFNDWNSIAEYLQDVYLEESETLFEELNN